MRRGCKWLRRRLVVEPINGRTVAARDEMPVRVDRKSPGAFPGTDGLVPYARQSGIRFGASPTTILGRSIR